MPGLLRRDPRQSESTDLFGRLDQLFDDWTRSTPFRWPERSLMAAEDWPRANLIRIDEYREGDDLVVRAELPGIDPDEDVEITVSDHHLHIEAHRREEEETEEKGFLRRELHHGYLSRDIPLPEAVTESDVEANYADGILRITVHLPNGGSPNRIPVERA
jgi:HSP20 family protein